MRRFEDKVVLVTGAASGIGRATALRVAEEGASVICADLQAEAAQETAKLAEERGGRAISRACDVSRPDEVAATVVLVDLQVCGGQIMAMMASLMESLLLQQRPKSTPQLSTKAS